MPDYQRARINMVESQLRPNRVLDPRVLAAMAEIPREAFVDSALRSIAYVDEDLPLGGGRYLMEPMVFGRLLRLLELKPDDVALDVGCATGYSSAVLARLVSAVVALEEDAELARRAGVLLPAHNCDNCIVVHGPLRVGCPAQAPYDAILIEGAVPEIPPDLTDQLAEGGRLAAVLDHGRGPGKAVLAARIGGVVSERVVFDANLPPLPGFAPEPRFVF